ncbi:putative phage tail assembly chaperone [uncultured Microbulbifer sp.]|mgnify:CR=1 FL=1|uniref:putative phage tail assembly chaperone n=1 Tax=uncultured Microbulbifer sp. TaxID=348147 RepID=UPI0026096C72|nr:putative phage tail assembly chaperone [uncultured Microbulbifer sp.]
MAAKTNEVQDGNTQTIEVSVGDKEFSFHVTREAYNKYLNSITPTSKVAPSHNFLVSTVDADDKEALVALVKAMPGAEVQLAGAVLEAYTPDLAITAKKRSN